MFQTALPLVLYSLCIGSLLGGCVTPQGATTSQVSHLVDVRLERDEVDAALSILELRLRGANPAAADWKRLFGSAGYRHLAERELAIGRPFTDSAFAAFLTSDTLLQRAPALRRAFAALEHIDMSAAAERALSYLPAGAKLRARLYLEIKPRTNSFVFTGADSTPSIFLYVRPEDTPAQLANTLTHELHHIGLSAACPDHALSRATAAQRMLLRYLGAYGEGHAMLAAAGSPLTHPHVADADSIRQRWDRDVARSPADIREQSEFFTAVLDSRITSADSVQEHAQSYFGTQGPWYTVGWLMASTIERELGRPVLIGTLCEPTRLLATYNMAAMRANARGATLPLWNSELIRRLTDLREAAE